MNTPLADPASLHLEKIVANAALISVVMKTTGDRSPCPECGRPSARVHSLYQRRLDDLPWEGVAVRLERPAGSAMRSVPTSPHPGSNAS